ncbi:hypothetical protein [Microbacterium testaceum]|uniref:Uncharacterized protein n=1 Tax=Microbacterium testaceum TaxID=2033 RepID=A0A147F732_MICTE|nr:hypothetical protein [Microbacterium testaceum]KTS11400.1 hypothetical protein RSA3_10455 [Microbacterium testaceum]
MDDADADDGHVIISFDVSTAVRVGELEQSFRAQPRSSTSFRYRLGTVTFDEPDAKARADKLNAVIMEFVDRLHGVPPAVLDAPETFVRLFMTLPAGAETLHTETVKRLADVGATIWIDA